MRILFVTSEIPFPPDNGVRIVSHHAMRLMAEAGHQLGLAVLTEETGDLPLRFEQAAAKCEVDQAWWMPLARRGRIGVQASAMFRRQPFFMERFRSPAFRDRLAKLIETFQPDVIHFDLILMAQYRDIVPPGIGCVASLNDSYALTLENTLAAGRYQGLSRWYRKQQLRQVCKYEKQIGDQFHVVHTMTEIDANYLRQLNPAVHVAVIPNGVAPDLFAVSDETRKQRDVIFVAKLDGTNLYYLRQFLEHGWPIVRRSCPEVKLHIIGKIGHEAEALQAEIGSDAGILFQGYASTLSDVYRSCGLSIVPVDKNCGIVNKAIEAMAAGLAVISFDKTFSGIAEAHPGEHGVMTEDYAGMGQAVVDLVRDEPKRLAIQQAAHQMASKHYTWASRKPAYEAMYQQAADAASTKQ